jgi:hypothetical protein
VGFFMLISILLASALASASGGSMPSNLIVQPCDFGDVYQFSNVQCQIELQNLGSEPIRISKLEAARTGDSLSAPNGLVVPPRSIAHVMASVNVENEEGMSRFYFRFETDEPGQKIRNAEVRGFVDSVLDQSTPLVDFGAVDLDALGEKKTLVLSSRATSDFRITGVLQTPPYVDVVIGGDKRSVIATLKSDAPLGPRQTDFIKLSVNTREQSQVWVRLKSDVRGDVVASSNPFALGLMRTDSTNEFLIRLVSRSGKSFRVGPVKIERVNATASVEKCIPLSSDCKLLRLLISKDQPTGQIGGVVRVGLPDTRQELPIFVWGMLLSPEVKVVDLGKEMEKKEQDAAVSSEPASPDVNIKSALKLAVRDAQVPPPPGDGPLIKWSATNEQLVYGYAVYRADSEKGPFVRVTDHVIQTGNADGTGSKYQWRDNSAISGRTYWYYIGILNRDGSKQQLSTPQKVVAK